MVILPLMTRILSSVFYISSIKAFDGKSLYHIHNKGKDWIYILRFKERSIPYVTKEYRQLRK